MAMVTPIRKKRNFKALQLSVAESAPTTARDSEPVAIRQAPPPVAPAQSAPVERKKRPPPMIIKAPKIPASSGAVSAVEQDGGLLTVVSGPPPPHSASQAVRRNTYHATLSNTLANLDMNAEIKFDLKDGDLKDLQELGQGNGGSVKKVEHVPTKTIMAKKVNCCSLLWLKLTRPRLPDCPDRCEAFGAETNPKGTSNNARLSFQVYYLFLGRFSCRSQHLHLYGIYGQRFSGWNLQEDWTHRHRYCWSGGSGCFGGVDISL